jgi:hypothetical protein
MNTYRFAVLAFLSLASVSLRGQLAPAPASSINDGVLVRGMGTNAGPDGWESSAGLGGYRSAVASGWTVPGAGVNDSIAGLRWGDSSPSDVVALKNNIATNGGTIRVAFVGSTGTWLNDFGYSYDGNPRSGAAYTAFGDIHEGTSISFGDFFDVNLAVGEGGTFDFWFNGDGGSAVGGLYSLFNPLRSDPAFSPGSVRWAQSPLAVTTSIPLLGAVAESTYLVGLEDWRLDRGADGDFTDLVIALQFYPRSGESFEAMATAVPEPATYGLCALVVVAAAIVRQSRRRNADRGNFTPLA